MPCDFRSNSPSPRRYWQLVSPVPPRALRRPRTFGAAWRNCPPPSVKRSSSKALKKARWCGTPTGIENATRYIQAFKKKYPFINANFWRSKTRQVTQRIVAEANAGKHLVDVIKPSTDLLPILLDRNLIGKYDTPLRAIYPAHAKSPFYTNMNYAFRVFAFNPRKVNARDAPKNWDDLLQPSGNERVPLTLALEEVMATPARRQDRTVNDEEN